VKEPSLKLQIAATRCPHVAYLDRALRRAHALLHPPLRELSLALVGDKRMADLHRRFLPLPGGGDVLSFELEHDRRGRVTAGEVIVCTSQAARQARRLHLPLRQELLLYALHGMLHLCSFDDRTTRGFAAMHRKEDQILAAIGVGHVFQPPGVR